MLSHPFVLAVISFLLTLSVSVSRSARDEGDACTADDAPGICKRLQNCPSVYEELLKGNLPREACGYADFEPVVCCPNGEATTTTTTERTTTTTGAPVTPRGPFDGWGVVAKSKCEKYAGSVYANVVSPALSTKEEIVNVSLCALKTQKLIVGGKRADPKEFPHMAAVGYDTGNGNGNIEWSCGGTLISERFVLTAAHCLYNTNWQAAASWVRLGDLNLQKTDDDAKPQNIRIITRIRHPKYKRPSHYHDIGLLELERDVVFDAWIRPSCLPYSLPDTGNNDKATATGWGRIDWNEDEGSNDLLKVPISLVSQSVCNQSFGSDPYLERGIVDEWQICAGDLGKDTCQGDSGGPLTIRNSDYDCMYSIIGITSIGRLCGNISPGVYTRVYNYVPWIESTVWPNS